MGMVTVMILSVMIDTQLNILKMAELSQQSTIAVMNTNLW